MLYILLIFIVSTSQTSIIYDFKKDSSTSNWRVVDDEVMGGLSNGKLSVNEQGFGLFSGNVSTKNNGGFSSIRYRFNAIKTSNNQKISIRIKGDGKRYQFRVKDKISQYHSYIYYFETNGEWQTISIPLKDMYPSFRGRKLTIPNFNHTQIEEIAFLIANKKSERFELLIDNISIN